MDGRHPILWGVQRGHAVDRCIHVAAVEAGEAEDPGKDVVERSLVDQVFAVDPHNGHGNRVRQGLSSLCGRPARYREVAATIEVDCFDVGDEADVVDSVDGGGELFDWSDDKEQGSPADLQVSLGLVPGSGGIVEDINHDGPSRTE